MATPSASCSRGHLTLVVDGEPVRVSSCHCLASRRRTGSAFSDGELWGVIEMMQE